MQLFADYVQPVTHWLYHHPHWALALTFLISFSESLAIIGSIVPGSVTMTAIGILAGSGVMRIDMTLLAAILGAVAGDSASYFMGYYFSDRLSQIWPFNRYPAVLKYGKQYFVHHGGKSVLVGRFAGPLRAIIPVIAGMMRMDQKRFLVANVLSAIGWSFLYVMPGVLIGAVSADLSAETATRLFIFVLLIILLFWLAGICLRWLILHANIWLEKNLHYFWKFSGRHPRLQHIVAYITPEDEKNHYPTVSLVLMAMLAFIALLILTLLVANADWIIQLNNSLHYFFNSLRSNRFDHFFSIVLFSYSPLTLLSTIVLFAILSLTFKKVRLFIYWIFVIVSTIIICGILNNLITSPYPPGNVLQQAGSSFPSTTLALMVAMLTFSSLLMSRNILQWPSILYRYFALVLSLLSGISALYLGDYWFTDVLASMLIGIFCSLVNYIFYRRQPYIRSISAYWILLIILVWAGGTFISAYFFLNQSMRSHRLVFTKKNIPMDQWWLQNANSAFPRYRNNRLGIPVDLFNIQYVGSPYFLENQLISAGWKRVNKSFWQVLLEKMNDSDPSMRLPILTQLYLNKKPELIMIRHFKKQNFVLRLWVSEYTINHRELPVFFATLQAYETDKHIKATNNQNRKNNFVALINDTLKSLAIEFESRKVRIELNKQIDWKTQVPPYVYLIREKF